MELLELFPTPILKAKISSEFSQSELRIINKEERSTYRRDGENANTRTKDDHVLDNPKMSRLKEELMRCCEYYYRNIVKATDDSKLTMSQSWVNYTKQNNYHFMHAHQNSFLTGVLYVSCDERDEVTFVNPVKQVIEPITTQPNRLHTTQENIRVESGDILIFLSTLEHYVAPRIFESDKVRSSIAFNTFPRGYLASSPVALNAVEI
jgi:uncharacterized protein (TIGR02466 family)